MAAKNFTIEQIRQHLTKQSRTVRSAQKKLSYDQFEELFKQAVKDSGILNISSEDAKALSFFTEEFESVAQKAMNNIREFESIIPGSMTITNSKLANEMGDLKLNEEKALSVGAPRKGTVPTFINATVSLYDDDNIKIVGNKIITPYEKCVHDAICSLLEAGNECVTASTVYRAINGMSDSENVSQKSIDQINAIIEKLRHLEISINFTEQAKEYQRNHRLNNNGDDSFLPDQPIEEAKISEVMLDFRKVTIKAGGHIISGYQYNGNRLPPVYAYSKQFKQIITIDRKLLNTKAVTRSTEIVVVLRSYLIQRIELMKNKHNKIDSDCISYDSIYKQLNISDEICKNFKKSSFDARQQAIKLMDFFKAEEYIKDYKAYRNGKKIAGLKVIL